MLLFLAQSFPVVFVVVFCFIALLSFVEAPWNASSTLLNYYVPLLSYEPCNRECYFIFILLLGRSYGVKSWGLVVPDVYMR